MSFGFKSQAKTADLPKKPSDRVLISDPVHVSREALIAMHTPAEGLALKSAKIRAQQGGQYLSTFKGRGMEFDEVRPYQPGDDVRTIDWRVTARSGKAHTKRFREERERSVLFWVDYRAPMFFATRGVFKSVLAAHAAALLAWSAVRHGDRLGGLVFSETQHAEVRPQRGKKGVLHFIQALVNYHVREENAVQVLTAEQAETAACQALIRLRRVARPGSLVFLVSDFRAMGAQSEAHLAQLSRHCDVLMFFITDTLEQNLPPGGHYRVSQGAKSLTLDTHDRALRERYRQKFQARQVYLKTLSQRYGIYLLPCATTDNLLTTLQRGLGRQARRRRA